MSTISVRMMRVDGKSLKKCCYCEEKLKDKELVIEGISTVFGNRVNMRQGHFACFVSSKECKALMNPEEYRAIYQKWLIEKI